MKTELRVFKWFFLTYKTMKTYCIVCKKDTENKNPYVFRTKNERLVLKSIC